MEWRNWEKVMGAILALILLMIFPITRGLIYWVLPLGSGVDDLIFFVLFFLAGTLLMIRVLPMKDKLRTFARWLSK